jgi:hypothetical protein
MTEERKNAPALEVPVRVVTDWSEMKSSLLRMVAAIDQVEREKAVLRTVAGIGDEDPPCGPAGVTTGATGTPAVGLDDRHARFVSRDRLRDVLCRPGDLNHLDVLLYGRVFDRVEVYVSEAEWLDTKTRSWLDDSVRSRMSAPAGSGIWVHVGHADKWRVFRSGAAYKIWLVHDGFWPFVFERYRAPDPAATARPYVVVARDGWGFGRYATRTQAELRREALAAAGVVVEIAVVSS